MHLAYVNLDPIEFRAIPAVNFAVKFCEQTGGAWALRKTHVFRYSATGRI